MACRDENVQCFYDWLAWSETKVPPGSMDHLGKIRKEKWEIIYKEPYGRCIIARDDIKAGEVLFIDHPVMTGPKQNCGYVCLGCYGQLPQAPDYFCSKCGWPLCDKDCESEGYHPLECPVFVKSKYKFNLGDFSEEFSLYESILPLRCLLLKSHDPKKWNTLRAMESHDDLRRGSELWNHQQVGVCDFLRKKIKIPEQDAEIHTVSGVLDINCHEVKSEMSASDECRIRGLYPLCAMLSHDCFSNTLHTFTDEMTMVMIASRDIPKGDLVTGTYTHLLSGTTERRKHLRYGKLFDCVCARCSDPTELGTFMSALRCTHQGCGGNVLNCNPLHPNNKADYACNKCRHQVSVNVVSRLTNLIYYELQNAGENNVAALEGIFNKYKPLLHPNHFHLIGIKHTLSQLYGRTPGYMISELTQEQLARKAECCRDLLAVIDVIDPGVSRLRGLTKYELHAPLLLKANREFQQMLLTREHFLQQLQETLKLLQDTVFSLQYEMPRSQEGQVCQIARGSSEELGKWIATVRQLPKSNFLAAATTTTACDDSNAFEEELTLEALLIKIESY